MLEKQVASSQNEDCVFFSDDCKREIRVIFDLDGKVLYCGMDIAACMGYEAPSKAVMRTETKKYKRFVPWVSKSRKGSTETICFDKRGAIEFVERQAVNPESMNWFFNEVVPRAEELGRQHAEKFAVARRAMPVMLAGVQAKISPRIEQSILNRLDAIILEVVMLKKEISNQA